MMATSGSVARDLQEQVVGVRGLSDNLDTGIAEQGREPVADQQAIVGDHDAHGITAESSFPPPRGLLIRS